MFVSLKNANLLCVTVNVDLNPSVQIQNTSYENLQTLCTHRKHLETKVTGQTLLVDNWVKIRLLK